MISTSSLAALSSHLRASAVPSSTPPVAAARTASVASRAAPALAPAAPGPATVAPAGGRLRGGQLDVLA